MKAIISLSDYEPNRYIMASDIFSDPTFRAGPLYSDVRQST